MSQRKTQRDRILDVLTNAHGEWVPLPTILELKISQFGARIKEARALGHQIENKTETVNGIVHSWYRLVSEPRTAQGSTPPESTSPAPASLLSTTAPASTMLAWETGRVR